MRFFVVISLMLQGLVFGQIQKFPGCTLVQAEWADGDSFQVRFPDGKTKTIRLYGVDCIEMHVNGDEWKEVLKDLELIAARAGRGAWAHTDWEKLPNFRKEARNEIAELDQAKGINKTTEDQPVDINTAARDELMNLPGIGEKTANLIIGERPFTFNDDMQRVPGIGPATLEKIRPFVTAGSP